MDATNELPCADKLVFDTQTQAKATALTSKWRYGGKPLKTYKCRYCELWHLASS